jgi:DNA repair ATPase RecN
LRAKAESDSEKINGLEEQLKQLHVLRRRYGAALEELKKAAEE